MPRIDLLTVGEAFQDLIFVGLPHLPQQRRRAADRARSSSTIGGGAVITATAASRSACARRSSARSARRRRAALRARPRARRQREAAAEPHAVTVSLSTRAIAASSRSTASTIGSSRGCRRRSPRQPARHVHFAFAPRHCARWTRIVDRLRARGVTTSWDFGWNPPLRGTAGFGALVAARRFRVRERGGGGALRAHARTAALASGGERANTIIKLGPRGSRWIAAAGSDVAAPAPRVRAWTPPAPATRSTAASSSPGSAAARRASACASATSSARSRRSPPAAGSTPYRPALPRCGRQGRATADEDRGHRRRRRPDAAARRRADHSDLPIEQIALYDIDQARLAIIGAVAQRMAAKGRVDAVRSVAECVAWADFVFTSIRVGGIEQRIHDEAVAQRHGIVGQETVGPAGFAMAARTIPHDGALRARDRRGRAARPGSSTSQSGRHGHRGDADRVREIHDPGMRRGFGAISRA